MVFIILAIFFSLFG